MLSVNKIFTFIFRSQPSTGPSSLELPSPISGRWLGVSSRHNNEGKLKLKRASVFKAKMKNLLHVFFTFFFFVSHLQLKIYLSLISR